MVDQLTQEQLKKIVHYDWETGHFARLPKRFSKSASPIPLRGTKLVIKGKIYGLRRLAWLYSYGEMPRDDVGPKNGDVRDFRLSNIIPRPKSVGRRPPKQIVPITQDLVRSMFTYHESTGLITRNNKTNKRNPGDPAGYVARNGYRKLTINGSHYLEHRIIWLYVHGRMPADQIDHIDGDRQNNKVGNLREATRAQNMQNLKVRSGRGGLTGVITHRRRF